MAIMGRESGELVAPFLGQPTAKSPCPTNGAYVIYYYRHPDRSFIVHFDSDGRVACKEESDLFLAID